MNLKQKLRERQLNKLAGMKAKTRALHEKRKQFLAEKKIKDDYRKAKKTSWDNSLAGRLTSAGKKAARSYVKKKRSGGLFADEGREIKTRHKRRDDDPFSKWDL